MNKNEFFFELPEELIAQEPAGDRSASKLLVLDKNTGKTTHRIFLDITEYISQGDCLVINDTKVLPARLMGKLKDTGAKTELLLLSQKENDIWEVLTKPGKKTRLGAEIELGSMPDAHLSARVLEVCEDGNRIVKFEYAPEFSTLRDAIEAYGEMPLPPYIKKKPSDANRYQTVYAAHEGSAAAPTAGLHFTPQLLDALMRKGVSIAVITLHVGLGTFRPVKSEDIKDHKMHSEFYNVEAEQADIINRAKKNGGKIIAVGTTSCRTLESCADENGFVKPGSGATDIFIYPGYEFKTVDKLITNFHLPESTLIMLVSALCGKENVLNAYKEAIDNKYRFFSFGDAMFIK